MKPIDTSFVERSVEQTGRRPEAVIPLLHAIQDHYGYLPEPALRRACELTEITPASIIGVSTFYTQFRHRPVGRHLIRVCHGTACHVKNAELVRDALLNALHIPDDGQTDTDADGQFTIEKVACLGCCTLAPVLQIDGITYGHLTPDAVPQVLHDFAEAQRRRAAARMPTHKPSNGNGAEIRVGQGSCCVAKGADLLHDALEQAVWEMGAGATVKRVGCVGICHQTPLVEVALPGREPTLYARVTADDAAPIVQRHFKPHGMVRRSRLALTGALDQLLGGESVRPPTHYSIHVRDPFVAPFLGPQTHIATEHFGRIDPIDLDEYLACDGFVAARRCADELTPEDVIDQIHRSGLRGRGGAGFSTGDKWTRVRAAEGQPKTIICNGDEGDPGAFMDRMLLESFPYRIIEGMKIAAHAVSAERGIFYIRAEYPLAVRRVREAIDKCVERGLLDDAFAITIMEGAGAFVCGEETALIASLEGRRGMPRLRPPFPAQQGLWNKPTLVNNVETFALIPWMIRHGSDAFAAMGTETSKGTKVFSLAGKVQRGGLIEVPMGVTIRQIVEQIGGGVPDGRRFKAVQIGGPSGGCVPAELADTPIDYEELASVGAIMGSGGLVVLDDADCMVDVARYFLQFTQDQSCGKCTLCRVGTRRMLDVLDRICLGHGKESDLDELEQLAGHVQAGSICGLGRTAPNPVLTTLRHFRDEYEAHVKGRCPAGRCKALIGYYVNDACTGCTLCAQHCPADAIAMTPYRVHDVDLERCTRCDTCRAVCPHDAVEVR